MERCSECQGLFHTRRGLQAHKRAHEKHWKLDLFKLGVVKRKLTPDESSRITKEVCEITENPDLRFKLAVMKAIQVTGEFP